MAIADILARRCVPVFQLLTAQIAARHLSVGAPLLTVRIRRPSFEGPFPPKKPGGVQQSVYKILDQFQVFREYVRIQDNRDQIDRLEDGRLNLKLLGKMWRSLDKEEKESYSEQYKELQVAHKKEVEDFLNRMGDNKKEYLKQLTKYRSQRTKYLQQFRLRKQGLLKGAMKKATETWKSLSVWEKKLYADKAEKLHKQRMAEYDERMEAMKA